MKLSKSKYVMGNTCEKFLWLSCYKKEELEEIDNTTVTDNGNEVGRLARNLFGNNYTIIKYNANYHKMIEDTQKELLNKPSIICEASFEYDNNFCSVDILKNDLDGVEIYEVKSSSKINDSYIDDISYQTWLLKKNGLNVKKSFLVYVNSNYVKNGEFDLNKYFIIQDVSNSLDLQKVENTVSHLIKIINNSNEPKVNLFNNCKECGFFKYCTRNLPKPNVFDVGWKTSFSKKIKMYNDNKITFEDVLNVGGFGIKANQQMKSELYSLEPMINKENIKKLLNSLTYPLYFLDFESYQSVIPNIDGTKPYQQICFQYSLHYYLEESGELYHKEYLSDDYDGNPMYGLCKKLCEDIPIDSCILVYNESFEKSRLKEMALLFPEFSEHLLNIRDNIIDLMTPFFNQDYYDKEMKGRWSIKVVLPVLFPNNPNLDYHNLEQVHKGDEASNAYLSLINLSKEEQETLRSNLLKYCELDTYAMVKIYEKLKEVVEEKQ